MVASPAPKVATVIGERVTLAFTYTPYRGVRDVRRRIPRTLASAPTTRGNPYTHPLLNGRHVCQVLNLYASVPSCGCGMGYS
jgi:hypothetical protein